MAQPYSSSTISKGDSDNAIIGGLNYDYGGADHRQDVGGIDALDYHTQRESTK